MRRLPTYPRLLLGSLCSAWPLRPTFPGKRGPAALPPAPGPPCGVSRPAWPFCPWSMSQPPSLHPCDPARAATCRASSLSPLSVISRGSPHPGPTLRCPPPLPSMAGRGPQRHIQPVSEALPGRAPTCLPLPLRTYDPLTCSLTPAAPHQPRVLELSHQVLHLRICCSLCSGRPSLFICTLLGPVQAPLLHPLPVYLLIERL